MGCANLHLQHTSCDWLIVIGMVLLVFDFLLACSGRGARVHTTNMGDDTPLHLAAAHGHLEVVQLVKEEEDLVAGAANAGSIPMTFFSKLKSKLNLKIDEIKSEQNVFTVVYETFSA